MTTNPQKDRFEEIAWDCVKDINTDGDVNVVGRLLAKELIVQAFLSIAAEKDSMIAAKDKEIKNLEDKIEFLTEGTYD